MRQEKKEREREAKPLFPKDTPKEKKPTSDSILTRKLSFSSGLSKGRSLSRGRRVFYLDHIMYCKLRGRDSLDQVQVLHKKTIK